MDRYNGILPVVKAPKMTSHDVVRRVRRITGVDKVGHTGTLDPMASGLLLLCLGQATKLSQFLTGWNKRYLAEITLGETSDTLDADGRLADGGPVPPITKEDLDGLLTRFTGRISQIVPAYSAVKQDGRRMYKLARRGRAIRLPEREVEIASLEIVSWQPPCLVLDVSCSKGTYIRALADDIGRELECGGYLSSLERLSIGRFGLDSAVTIEEIGRLHEIGELDSVIIPPEEAVDFPKLRLREQARETIRNGRIPSAEDILSWNGEFSSGDFISVVDEAGRIMAIGRSRSDRADAENRVNRDFFSYVRVLI